MEKYEYVLLALMWGGAILSGIVGKIYNPMCHMDRRENPKEFWETYFILMIIVVVFTLLAIVY